MINNSSRPIPYRLYTGLLRIRPNALNAGSGKSAPVEDSAAILATLKCLMQSVENVAFDVSQGKVRYAALAESPLLHDYRQAAQALQHLDLRQLQQRAEKLAFWINLYNLLTVDAVLAYGLQTKMTENWRIFDAAGYIVGGHFFSLSDIEHGILRANRGLPYLPGAQFSTHDPRLNFILPALDPRVHFALVCGAESCPPIQRYTAEAIDAQLDLAARSFINSSAVQFDPSTGKAYLSRLFEWYGVDFGASPLSVAGLGSKAPQLRFIASYLQDEALKAWLLENSDRIRVSYQSYDWTINRVGQ